MTSLPEQITIQLHDLRTGSPVEGMLVALHLFHTGRYYFGTLAGLTDASGVVHTSSAAINAHFAENRQIFLMDYKVPLEECDAVLRVVVEGGSEFEARRRAVVESGLLTPAAQRLWTTARNPAIASIERTVPFGPDAGPLTISILVGTKVAQ